MALEAAYAFDDLGSTTVVDFSGNGRDIDLTGTNGVQVAGGNPDGALGKTGATMPVLPASVLAACETDDRGIMFDAQNNLNVWWVRFEKDAIGSGTWGVLNIGDVVMEVQARRASDEALATRPAAALPGAAYHNYCATYVRSTGIISFYRDGALVSTSSFAAGTQLSVGADRINLAEWTDTGPALDNLRLFSHAPDATEVLSLAGTAVGATEVTGTALAALGSLTGTATGARTVVATVNASLGGVTATGSGTRSVTSTTMASLGVLTATVTGEETAVALAQYTDQFWFPDGSLAANIHARVFPENSNALASLYTDATGATALPNPVATTSSGVLTFFAEVGNYWVHIDSETFPITVGMSQSQASMSTGTASGGEINVNAGNPAAVDIGAIDGYVVTFDNATQNEPTVTRVTTSAQTVVMDAGALARTITWWVMDATGTVIQRATKPSNAERRSLLTLGVTTQEGGIILTDQTLPVFLRQPANQLVDLMDSLGPFLIQGSVITANGANLSVNQSAGTLFARAFNHFSGPVITDDPNVNTVLAQTPAQFRYITRSALVFGPLRTTLDVANYDNNGVITSIGGGGNNSTLHRIFLFAANTANAQLVVQYGQTIYSSLSNAVNAIGSGTFVVNPLILGVGTLIAYVAVTRSATNLTDPAQAIIITAGRFDVP